MTGYTESLAQWLVSQPPVSQVHLLDKAGNAMLDIIACMFAGCQTKEAQICLAVSEQWGTVPEEQGSWVWGTNKYLPPANAAFVNATAAHVLDFDDNFIAGFTHATAVLAPALFALADQRRCAGIAVLDAYLFGLELQASIGGLVNPEHYRRGWHATATVGTIGTAGACARLLGLDVTKTLSALSIASSLASGSKKQFGSMLKPVHAGIAAKHAVEATLLAEQGLTADQEPLTGKWGFADLFSDIDPTKIVPNHSFDLPLAIEEHGLHVKRFPCCGSTHRALDAIEDIRKRHSFYAEDIDSVEISVSVIEAENLRYIHPRNVMEARFSMHYCIARYLMDGDLNLANMCESAVSDSGLDTLIDRIIMRPQAQAQTKVSNPSVLPITSPAKTNNANLPGSVVLVLRLNDGITLSAEVFAAKGSKDNPLSPKELDKKFYDCTRHLLKPSNADKVLDVIRSIQSTADFKEISTRLNLMIQ